MKAFLSCEIKITVAKNTITPPTPTCLFCKKSIFFFAGPDRPRVTLPRKLSSSSSSSPVSAANSTALLLSFQLPPGLDGRRGYYEVFLTEGLK